MGKYCILLIYKLFEAGLGTYVPRNLCLIYCCSTVSYSALLNDCTDKNTTNITTIYITIMSINTIHTCTRFYNSM